MHILSFNHAYPLLLIMHQYRYHTAHITMATTTSSPPLSTSLCHPAAPSGLHSSSRQTGKVARWVCDRCGAIIDKRKCSFDEAAADGYHNGNEGDCVGGCDHAEQTMRYVHCCLHMMCSELIELTHMIYICTRMLTFFYSLMSSQCCIGTLTTKEA